MKDIIESETIKDIKDKYPSICYSCKNNRRPASDDNTYNGYVGCSAYLDIMKDMDINNNPEYPDYVQDAKEIGIGWVDLKAHINTKKSGIITNFQMMALEVKKCNKFKVIE